MKVNFLMNFVRLPLNILKFRIKAENNQKNYPNAAKGFNYVVGFISIDFCIVELQLTGKNKVLIFIKILGIQGSPLYKENIFHKKQIFNKFSKINDKID
jgi:hypothetical protein